MNTLALIQTLSSIGVRLSNDCGNVRVAAPKGVVTAAMRRDLADRKTEILAILADGPDTPPLLPATQAPAGADKSADTSPIIEDGRRVRWTKADERDCRKCKRCGGPIIWAQVIEDSDPKAKRRAFIRLDPDLMLHGCGGPRAGRNIDIDPQPIQGRKNP